MPKRRVHQNQLSIGKHIRAPERQRLADDLEVEISRKRDQLRFTRLLLEDERYLGNRPGPQEQWKQHRERLQELQAREVELVADLQKLGEKLCQLGGHPNFRTPVVEGYGLADALRELRN